MAVAAGRLNRRVQFLRKAQAVDGFGYAETWQNAGASQAASKKDIGDGERWRAGEVQAHVTTRFVVRYSAFTRDINPGWRLNCEGQVYDIFGVKELEMNRFIEITAAARNDDHQV
jgi:SPP1 family predicted phage head-tail adaptor